MEKFGFCPTFWMELEGRILDFSISISKGKRFKVTCFVCLRAVISCSLKDSHDLQPVEKSCRHQIPKLPIPNPKKIQYNPENIITF